MDRDSVPAPSYHPREDINFQFFNMKGLPINKYDKTGEHRTRRDLMGYKHRMISIEMFRDTADKLGGRR